MGQVLGSVVGTLISKSNASQNDNQAGGNTANTASNEQQEANSINSIDAIQAGLTEAVNDKVNSTTLGQINKKVDKNDSFSSNAGKTVGILVGNSLKNSGKNKQTQETSGQEATPLASIEANMAPTRQGTMQELYAQQQQKVAASEPQLKSFEDYFSDNNWKAW